jgi:hypothetical protein
VRDEIEFGLVPGGELEVEATVCHEIRQSHQAVVIDNVAEDAAFCGHRTPAKYGFQSYISRSGRHFSETAGWPGLRGKTNFCRLRALDSYRTKREHPCRQPAK